MAHISREEIHHLAELSRIQLDENSVISLQKDLEGILSHFEELKELEVDTISPKTGGALTVNQLRSDTSETRVCADVVNSFPDREGNLLKVPKVFDK